MIPIKPNPFQISQEETYRMRKQSLLTLLILILLLGALAACGGDDKAEAKPTPAATAAPQIVGDAKAGETVYMSICVACHGPDARGLPNLGKSMHPDDSEFIVSKTDEELVAFILVGRTPDDPLNTTGVGMPAKGGNPAITEQNLYDVVAWMRTLE